MPELLSAEGNDPSASTLRTCTTPGTLEDFNSRYTVKYTSGIGTINTSHH